MKTGIPHAFRLAFVSLLATSVLLLPSARAGSGLNLNPKLNEASGLNLRVVVGNPVPPNPQLALIGADDQTSGGTPVTSTNLKILNWEKFPPELFNPAPKLPPCGKNKNASRTWLTIYNADDGKYIYGFCALSSPAALQKFSYLTPKTQKLPKQVYVVLTDRQTNATYKSNCINAWNGSPCSKP